MTFRDVEVLGMEAQFCASMPFFVAYISLRNTKSIKGKIPKVYKNVVIPLFSSIFRTIIRLTKLDSGSTIKN